MGAVISRWRKQPSTIEVLEKLEKEIDAIEQLKRGNLEKQRRIIGSLLLYSVLLYIIGACVLYFYYLPSDWPRRIKYSAPLLVFPFLIYALKRFLHWYFVKRITKNESALEDLREKKKTILEEVMEKETYKKAKEILERFDPEKNKQLQNLEGTPMRPQSPDGQELRRRVTNAGATPGPGVVAGGAPGSRVEALTPGGPAGRGRGGGGGRTPGGAAPASPVINSPQMRNGQHSFVGTPGRPPPGPPMPRPILPRDRSATDRLMELLIGDGPQNRYALICTECKSHNGMALREEFEFVSFRCCYCYTFNPARKQKPQAPRIEKRLSSVPDDRPLPGDVTDSVSTRGATDAAPQTQTEDSRLSEDDDSLISNDSDDDMGSKGHASAARSQNTKKDKVK